VAADVAIHSGASPKTGGWQAYLQIARPDHWFKNVFVLPGVGLALALSREGASVALIGKILLALVATSLIASANYTINEWLDAEHDRHHPVKNRRPAATLSLSAPLIWLQWLGCATAGLATARCLNLETLVFAAALLFMGVVYNVRPLRTKERVFLDVLSEAVNNPIRFLIGWSLIVKDVLPPSSVLFAYWMGGAYLMAVKRYSEYRFIGDPKRAGLYRASFRFYSENTLLLSSFFYAMTSMLFLGVFLVKYRIEFLLGLPLLVVLFVWYLAIGMRENSVAQRTEKLYAEKALMSYVAFVAAVFALLLFVDIPALNELVDYHVLRG